MYELDYLIKTVSGLCAIGAEKFNISKLNKLSKDTPSAILSLMEKSSAGGIHPLQVNSLSHWQAQLAEQA